MLSLDFIAGLILHTLFSASKRPMHFLAEGLALSTKLFEMFGQICVVAISKVLPTAVVSPSQARNWLLPSAAVSKIPLPPPWAALTT